jgi:hypothetical protein
MSSKANSDLKKMLKIDTYSLPTNWQIEKIPQFKGNKHIKAIFKKIQT